VHPVLPKRVSLRIENIGRTLNSVLIGLILWTYGLVFEGEGLYWISGIFRIATAGSVRHVSSAKTVPASTMIDL